MLPKNPRRLGFCESEQCVSSVEVCFLDAWLARTVERHAPDMFKASSCTGLSKRIPRFRCQEGDLALEKPLIQQLTTMLSMLSVLATEVVSQTMRDEQVQFTAREFSKDAC